MNLGKYSKALTAGVGAATATFASLQANGDAEWICVVGAAAAGLVFGILTYGVPNDIVDQVKKYIADAHDIVKAVPPLPDTAPAKPVTMAEMDARGVQLNAPKVNTTT